MVRVAECTWSKAKGHGSPHSCIPISGQGRGWEGGTLGACRQALPSSVTVWFAHTSCSKQPVLSKIIWCRHTLQMSPAFYRIPFSRTWGPRGVTSGHRTWAPAMFMCTDNTFAGRMCVCVCPHMHKCTYYRWCSSHMRADGMPVPRQHALRVCLCVCVCVCVCAETAFACRDNWCGRQHRCV